MERLFKVMIGMLAVAALLIGAAWFFLKHQISTGGPATTRLASAVPAESSPADPCHEAIVLTLQSHSGVSASMSAQTLDGQDVPTQDASGDEAGFTTACYQPDGAGDPEGSPQTIKICKPASFVLHISGNGKGVFDLQAKPLPDVPHPVSPLLLCAYALDSDRVYDWVVKYQKGAKPAVFLVGSKGDPNITP
jgi:hypothetical protein